MFLGKKCCGEEEWGPFLDPYKTLFLSLPRSKSWSDFFLMSAKESPLEGFPILSLSSNLISQYAFFDPSWMWHVVFPNTIYPFPLIPSTFISTYSNFPNSSEINSGSISIRKYIEINFFKIYCNALLHMKSNLIRYYFFMALTFLYAWYSLKFPDVETSHYYAFFHICFILNI